MPLYLENLNMDFFLESEEKYDLLRKYVASKGQEIKGYYNLPYFNYHFGKAQMILRTDFCEPSEETGGHRIQASDVDTHSSGNCVWKSRVSGININKKDAEILEKRVMVTPMDERGMAVVNIVNADVLPSYMEDDVLTMQMVAFPNLIEYYENAEDYASHQPEAKDGKKWLIGEGSVIPTGMLRNRDPNSDEFESDESLDDLTAISGIVKKLYWGMTEINGESHKSYLKCIIDTFFGELEIAHTVEQVEEQLRPNIKVGSTVVMYGILSGDVAIYEYEKGIIRDEQNNLAAMRYMISCGEPERIRSILSENVKYVSQNGSVYEGVDAVVDQMKYVKASNPGKYFAHFAEISSVDDGDEELDYSVGEKCLVLAYDEKTNYESIAFFDYDDDGNICRMITSTNPRYHFSIQTPIFKSKDVDE